MCYVKNGCFWVQVNGDDFVGLLHPSPMLYCARDPDGYVQFGTDRQPGLADLALRGNETCVHCSSSASEFRPQYLGKFVNETEIVLRTEAIPACNYDWGALEVVLGLR